MQAPSQEPTKVKTSYDRGQDIDTVVADAIITDGRRWTFGSSTPEHFADHINRSIPLYLEGHQIVCGLSDYFMGEKGLCYELGSSVGDLTAKLADRHASLKGARFVGLDEKAGMVEQSVERFANLPNLQFVRADVLDYSFERCDLAVSYYTLQFIEIEARRRLVKRLYDNLKQGGALVVFEKTNCEAGAPQDMMANLYVDFKIQNGFSAKEILAKTASLKGVLNPLTSAENHEMLKAAGFRNVFTISKFLQFEGYVAVK